MARFLKTGAITHYAAHSEEYGDATQVDLLDAQLVVAQAQTMFEELPSNIRKKFENDPGKFLDFVQNPANLEEMQELGLANKTPVLSEKDKSATQSENAPTSTEKTETTENKGDGQGN